VFKVSYTEILTVDQVADLVQLSPRTVMRAIHTGDLEASQLTQGRGGWRVREDAIDDWLAARSNRSRPNQLVAVTSVDPVSPRPRPGRSTTTAQVGGRLAP
jgi:excisionase family DNA binding protein